MTLQPSEGERERFGYDFLHGNELELKEKHNNKLMWERPMFNQQRAGDYEPCRPTYEMLRLRTDETLGYGRRRMGESRKFQHEFPDRIKEMEERLKKEEAERTGKDPAKVQRVRWWHRKTAVELRDPLKMLRFNNLTFSPEELMTAKDIVFLQLTGCKLGDAGMSWISAFLQQSYTIKRLCLQGNHITAEGCKELFLGLRTTKTLLELDISLNPIDDDGCATICNAFSENSRHSKVYTVNMSCCKLGPGAAFHLARLIRDFKPLQALLLWRNNLGCMTPMKVGGVASILEELRATTSLKLLNLTANVISDADAAFHANAREVERRRRSQLEMDKKRQQTKVEELQRKVKEKRREAIWDDQRVQIASLEKELEQERSRLRVAVSLEQKSRTGAQRAELEFQNRVSKATGADIVVPKVLPRLMLTGNHSIRRQTLKRLAQFYDLDEHPDADEFVKRRRRYDNIVVSRRQLGEEYTGPRDVNTFDDFNVWHTYPFDPETDHARRTAMNEWREDQRQRAINAVSVKFEKFAWKGPKEPPKPGAKLVAGGFKVASGVGDNIRTVQQDQVREKPKEEIKIRTVEPSAADVKVKTNVTTKREVEVEVVHKKADAPQETVPEVTAKKSLPSPRQPTAKKAPPELALNKSLPSPRQPPSSTTSSPRLTEEESITTPQMESVEEFDFDQGSMSLGGEEEHSELLAALMDTVAEDNTAYQEKVDQRMAEHKAKLEQKVKSTPRSERQAARVVASLPPAEAGSPLIGPGLGFSSSQTLSGTQSAELSASVGGALSTSMHGPPVPIPELPLTAACDNSAVVHEFVVEICRRKEKIRLLSEKGSPSDEDLAQLEAANNELGQYKKSCAEKLNAFDTAVAIGPDQVESTWDFIEDLVKETDLPAGNTELFAAVLAKVATDYPAIFEQRGLPAMAACDSSQSYLKMMLSVPEPRVDVTDLLSSCFFNQTARIPISLLVLSQPETVVDVLGVSDELSAIWQEFFEDVASNKRSIPREDRTGRMELLNRMLELSEVEEGLPQKLTIDIEEDGSDGQSILFRAAAEGDAPLMKLLLDHKSVSDINATKSSGMTVLLAAVVGNSVDVLKVLDEKFGSQLNLQCSSENGNAYDLANGLGRCKEVVAWVKGKGVKPTGKNVKAKIAPKKAAGKKTSAKAPATKVKASKPAGKVGRR